MREVTIPVELAWFQMSRLDQALQIERKCFAEAWDSSDFTAFLRGKRNIGMMAIAGPLSHSCLAGFALYTLYPRQMHLVSLAVDPDFQRGGVGSAMVRKLQGKLHPRRPIVTLGVRETNLAAQLFFKSHGFRATSVMQGFYDDSAEDAFIMQFTQLGEAGPTKRMQEDSCQTKP